MNTEFTEIVKKILDTNIYLTMATVHGTEPWANAVFFAADKNYNLYFTSYTNSLHLKNLTMNPNVGVTIFDSHQPAGTGEGVQITGKAFEVAKEELPAVIAVLYERRFPNPQE